MAWGWGFSLKFLAASKDLWKFLSSSLESKSSELSRKSIWGFGVLGGLILIEYLDSYVLGDVEKNWLDQDGEFAAGASFAGVKFGEFEILLFK